MTEFRLLNKLSFDAERDLMNYKTTEKQMKASTVISVSVSAIGEIGENQKSPDLQKPSNKN